MAPHSIKASNIQAQVSAALDPRTWQLPIQMAALAQEYARTDWLERRLLEWQHRIKHLWATFVDLHPFTTKNIYGAKIDDFDKDIFVDTSVLSRRPRVPHTTITVHINSEQQEDIALPEQVCYTDPPFYFVTRSWSDAGNPRLTTVEDVGIFISSADPLSISVLFKLEDGRSEEVTLRELGDVILVHPQQGEVAELVMSLAKANVLPGLEHIRAKRLKYENLEDSQKHCARLFCHCNQIVNANMAQFVEYAQSGDEEEVYNKLKDELWRYSMPRDFSLWDNDQLVECFKFQNELAALSNKYTLILQPECGWGPDSPNTIRIAEDTSLLVGWQRQPPSNTGMEQKHGRNVVGTILPSCIMDVSRSEAKKVMEGIAGSRKTKREAPKENPTKYGKHDVVRQLRDYLDGPDCVKPDRSPTRLWNVVTDRVESVPNGTRYCAVSYVWEQWYEKTINVDKKIDSTKLREWLLEVRDATGIDWFWVDSFCIKQGDEQDMSTELPKMARYYGEAAFTVALLRDVDERQRTRTPVPWQVVDIEAHYRANEKLIQSYSKCKWLSRIWTMQEAWLAKRLIVKTKKDFIRGDYLELLRMSQIVVKQYKDVAVPMCLEWMNIGPSLVLGACTGNLLIPGEIPSLLTRPGGSLLQNNSGDGLQTRTTTLLRALRLSNGRNATLQADRLIGLLGMVEQGEKLAEKVSQFKEEGKRTVIKRLTNAAHTQAINPVEVFKLAASQRMLGPEIMLCRGRLKEKGLYWLPNLRDDPKSVELPHTASLVAGGLLEVTEAGATINALRGRLDKIKIKPRGTVNTGETIWNYDCSFQSAASDLKLDATIQSIEELKDYKMDILIMRRPGKQGPFIAIRGEPKHGRYRREQGFLLKLRKEVCLEDGESRNFQSYIVG
ncbi:heterokaryon incompatibility protein-domain-containing protein [Pestalotiopsis sp. NC0098]|nr:heterokaryon incompatibility protein-domain-containing protein [Pestalotiopsis sp. NC0098]